MWLFQAAILFDHKSKCGSYIFTRTKLLSVAHEKFNKKRPKPGLKTADGRLPGLGYFCLIVYLPTR